MQIYFHYRGGANHIPIITFNLAQFSGGLNDLS